MDLRELLAALRRRWWLPIACAAIAGALGLAVPSGDTLRSEGLLVVGADPGLVGEGARFSAVDEIDQELIFTFSDIADGGEALAAASEASGVSLDGLSIDAVPGMEAKTLRVRVEGTDADDVEAMTAAVMDEAVTRFLSLYDIFQVQVVDPPSTPVSTDPSSKRLAGVAALLGLAVGLALVWLEALYVRWRDRSGPEPRS
jgi:hypothetical protein